MYDIHMSHKRIIKRIFYEAHGTTASHLSHKRIIFGAYIRSHKRIIGAYKRIIFGAFKTSTWHMSHKRIIFEYRANGTMYDIHMSHERINKRIFFDAHRTSQIR